MGGLNATLTFSRRLMASVIKGSQVDWFTLILMALREYIEHFPLTVKEERVAIVVLQVPGTMVRRKMVSSARVKPGRFAMVLLILTSEKREWVSLP